MIHVIWEEWGPTAARGFISQVQWLLNHWLLHHGFTIGISDTIADDGTMREINDTITKAKADVKEVINLAQKGELEMQPGMTMQQSFEQKVNQILNKARDNAGNSAQSSLDDTNNVKMTVQAGSKGSFLNISQMIACVGQQNVEGKRIPFGFDGRSLPHFTKDDFGPESRGFVENSYLRGLTPQEFFFHAMGGREGLIDTAVKTSETGYIQRRLVKAMEDIIVKYDGTVRNSAGDVIQFLYGEDGMDATYVESQKIDTLRHNKEKFRSTFHLDPDEPAFGKGYMSESQAFDLASSVEKRALLDAEWEQVLADREELRTTMSTGDPGVHLPVNLKRIIWNAQKNYGLVKDVSAPGREREELQAVNVIESVRSLLNGLVVVPGQDALSLEAQRNSTILFFALVRSTLSAKRVMREFKLSPAAFNWVIGEVESRFKMALAPPGDGIGTVAAQSIGEPATQMTLNTFHFAGRGEANVTLGIPRLRELLMAASKKLATPVMTLPLRDEHRGDLEAAKNLARRLRRVRLAELVKKLSVESSECGRSHGGTGALARTYQITVQLRGSSDISKEGDHDVAEDGADSDSDAMETSDSDSESAEKEKQAEDSAGRVTFTQMARAFKREFAKRLVGELKLELRRRGVSSGSKIHAGREEGQRTGRDGSSKNEKDADADANANANDENAETRKSNANDKGTSPHFPN